MYVRTVEERPLTFVVSGKLWNSSLVMMDEETRSLLIKELESVRAEWEALDFLGSGEPADRR